MRIQNNIMAMNTHRMYTTNNNNVAKSAEKLSSGYRINRAGDDAAGLAISEKMRAQIRGLNMASKNSQDAVSLVQTAEGALQEVHSMLQRMNELAVQSASGTNDSGVDRAALQQEFKNLQDEIDQIADTTTFNDMKLLDGSLASDVANVKVATASTLKNGATLAGADGTNYTVTQHTGLSNQVGSYAITDQGNGKINVAFTDADTGDVKNTVIDLNTAVNGEIGAGKSFQVDLSEAGLGVYTITADGSGTTVNATDLAAALGGKAVTTEKVASNDAAGAIGKMDSTKAGVTQVNARPQIFEIDLAGLKADSTDADNTFTLTIGGTALTATAAMGAGSDGAAIAAAVVAANGGTITINGGDYTLSNNGSKLLLTADDNTDRTITNMTYSATKSGGTSGGGSSNTPDSTAITVNQTNVATTIAAVQGEAVFKADVSQVADGAKFTIDGKTYVLRTPSGEADAAAGEELIVLADADIASNTAFATKLQTAIGAATTNYNVTDNGDGTITFQQKVGADASTADLKGIMTFTPGTGAAAGNAGADTTKGALRIQVGAQEGQTLDLSITAMNTKGLQITKDQVSIATQDQASKAITATRTAINTVSTQRAELGAMQNRLEHKIANLDNTAENLSAAESRIRDVDMAKEMTNFTKNNILAQAATAMLAQANAAPQGVLSLLQ